MSQGDLRAYLGRPLSRRERLARHWLGFWLRLLGLLAVGAALTGCPGPGDRTPEPRWPPRRTPPPAVVTLAPTLVPIPSVSPLGTREPWAMLSRSLATPEAPVLDATESYPTNMRCYGDCVTLGNSSLMLHDFVAAWSHADPALVDHYEILRASDDPYFDPDSCPGCTVTLSTGLTGTVEGSPPAFQPIGGWEGVTQAGSGVDAFVVRAVNAAGESEASNRIGVMMFSFLTAEENYNPYAGVWPPPTATYAP